MIICYTAENGKFVDLLKRTDIYLTLFLWVRNQGVTQLGGSVSGSLRRLQSRSQPGFGGPAPRVHSQGCQGRRQENKSQISLLEGEGLGIFIKEAGWWLALGVENDECRQDEVVCFLCRST